MHDASWLLVSKPHRTCINIRHHKTNTLKQPFLGAPSKTLGSKTSKFNTQAPLTSLVRLSRGCSTLPWARPRMPRGSRQALHRRSRGGHRAVWHRGTCHHRPRRRGWVHGGDRQRGCHLHEPGLIWSTLGDWNMVGLLSKPPATDMVSAKKSYFGDLGSQCGTKTADEQTLFQITGS